MCGGSSFHRRRFLAGVPRSTSSGSINLWIHRLRRTFGAVFGRGCGGRRSVCATPLYRYLCMPRSFYTSVVSVCCVSACGVSAYRAVCRVSGAFCTQLLGTQKIPGSEEPGIVGAPEGIRTPNLLIRSQMLYPLSYRRMFLASDFFNPVAATGTTIRMSSRVCKPKNSKSAQNSLRRSRKYPVLPRNSGVFVVTKFFQNIFIAHQNLPRRHPKIPLCTLQKHPEVPQKIFSPQKNVMRRT